jgi:hypothetical protein
MTEKTATIRAGTALPRPAVAAVWGPPSERRLIAEVNSAIGCAFDLGVSSDAAAFFDLCDDARVGIVIANADAALVDYPATLLPPLIRIDRAGSLSAEVGSAKPRTNLEWYMVLRSNEIGFDLLRCAAAAHVVDALAATRRVFVHPRLRGLIQLRRGLSDTFSPEVPVVSSVQALARATGCSPRKLELDWRILVGSPTSGRLKDVIVTAVLLRGLLLWLERPSATWSEVARTLRISPRTFGEYCTRWIRSTPSALNPESVCEAVSRLETLYADWLPFVAK